jgi:hypothetical protein
MPHKAALDFSMGGAARKHFSRLAKTVTEAVVGPGPTKSIGVIQS